MRRYTKRCLIGLGAFALLYVVAGAIAFVGVNGWLGFEANSFAIVGLMALGLPWTMVLAVLPDVGLPPVVGQGFIAMAPLVNFWFLSRLCRRRRRGYRYSDPDRER